LRKKDVLAATIVIFHGHLARHASSKHYPSTMKGKNDGTVAVVAADIHSHTRDQPHRRQPGLQLNSSVDMSQHNRSTGLFYQACGFLLEVVTSLNR